MQFGKIVCLNPFTCTPSHAKMPPTHPQYKYKNIHTHYTQIHTQSYTPIKKPCSIFLTITTPNHTPNTHSKPQVTPPLHVSIISQVTIIHQPSLHHPHPSNPSLPDPSLQIPCSKFPVQKSHHHPSSIIHYPSSIIHHPSSMIDHSSSIINHSSFIIHHSLSTIHHPSSIIHHVPSVIARYKYPNHLPFDPQLPCNSFRVPTRLPPSAPSPSKQNLTPKPNM